MPEYVCQKCDKKFNQKSHYDYHINRKNPCAPSGSRIDKLEKEIAELKEQLEKILIKKEN